MTVLRGSEMDVFPLCLGGNVFGWTSDAAQSHAVLDAYAAAGGNFIDTAESYSAWVPGHTGGESETIIGDWLRSRSDADAMIIATKTGHDRNLRRDRIMLRLVASQRRYGCRSGASDGPGDTDHRDGPFVLGGAPERS